MQQVFRAVIPLPLGRGSSFESLLAQATLTAPSYTLRGGTTEILRTITARATGGVHGLCDNVSRHSGASSAADEDGGRPGPGPGRRAMPMPCSLSTAPMRCGRA